MAVGRWSSRLGAAASYCHASVAPQETDPTRGDRMKLISSRKLRTALLALTACAAMASIGAGSAAASATLNVTSDTNVADTPTALTLNTALSGLFNDRKQYGAVLNLPAGIGIPAAAYGDTSNDRCPGGSVQAISGGLTPVARSFDVSSCPVNAIVGTATLGSTSGKIYMVNTTPMPSFGIWFDTGTTPYGRHITVDYNGSAPILRVFGLKSASTNGLTLSFNNPDRTIYPKIWSWAQSGDSTCTASNSFGGTAYTYPYWGSTATSVGMSNKNVTIRGCGLGYKITTSNKVQGQKTAVELKTTLTGTGNDAKQYGASFHLPGNIHFAFDAYGNSSTQMCSPTSFSANPTGMIPGTRAFTPVNCPAEAKIGTATLGGATGTIYLVSQSPTPFHAVYFDQGISTPYGRQISPTWDSNGKMTLTVMGLANTTSTGLTLNYTNPARPNLPGNVFENAMTGDAMCGPAGVGTTADIYTWPASGTTADGYNGFYYSNTITGC